MNYFSGMPAHYSNKHSPAFRGNPWLEALPVFEDDDEIRTKLEDSSGFFNPEWRQLETHERQALLVFINNNLFVPRECHVETTKTVLSYLTARYLGEPVHSYSCFSTDPVIPGKPRRPYAKNIPLIGPAGTGKTLAIQRILDLIPQTIVHSKHAGRCFRMTQVTHLLVHCPSIGGGKALLQGIVLELERVLGTKLPSDPSQAKAENILQRQTTLTGLGCIVINEFQNILTSGSYSRDMMSAVNNLNEKCGVPLILAGTPEVFDVIAEIPHGARRVSGSPPWRPFKKGEGWEKWGRSVFKFNLTKEEPQFDDSVSEYFFAFSQGNPDAAVSLFTTAQGLALSAKRERIEWADYEKARKHLYMRDPDTLAKKKGTSKTSHPGKRNGNSTSPIEDPIADPSKVDEEPPPLR